MFLFNIFLSIVDNFTLLNFTPHFRLSAPNGMLIRVTLVPLPMTVQFKLSSLGCAMPLNGKAVRMATEIDDGSHVHSRVGLNGVAPDNVVLCNYSMNEWRGKERWGNRLFIHQRRSLIIIFNRKRTCFWIKLYLTHIIGLKTNIFDILNVLILSSQKKKKNKFINYYSIVKNH